MRIVADVRERGSGVPALLGEYGVDVELRPLSVSDYVLGGSRVVERKTIRGLHLDLISGRFWRQFGLLRRRTGMPYLLVEGTDLDDGPLSTAAIRGACLSAADLGVPLIRSASSADSALWIRLLAARSQGEAPRSRSVYARRPQSPVGPASAEAALAAVPGISTVTAQSLLHHFGRLAAVVAADPREWRRVPGMGEARSRALLTTLRAAPTTNRSRRRRERSGPST